MYRVTSRSSQRHAPRESTARSTSRSACPPSPPLRSIATADSVAGQFVGGGSSGVCGAAQEVGEQLELGVAVFGADLVH